MKKKKIEESSKGSEKNVYFPEERKKTSHY